MKRIDNYITEKLKIGKNTLSKNDIVVNIETNKYDNVIDKIVEYCEQLSLKPNAICEKFTTLDGVTTQYDDILIITYPNAEDLLFCFGICVSDKLSNLYKNVNMLYMIGTNSGRILYSYTNKNIDEIFEIIETKSKIMSSK